MPPTRGWYRIGFTSGPLPVPVILLTPSHAATSESQVSPRNPTCLVPLKLAHQPIEKPWTLTMWP
jgi:hypothetical protein